MVLKDTVKCCEDNNWVERRSFSKLNCWKLLKANNIDLIIQTFEGGWPSAIWTADFLFVGLTSWPSSILQLSEEMSERPRSADSSNFKRIRQNYKTSNFSSIMQSDFVSWSALWATFSMTKTTLWKIPIYIPPILIVFLLLSFWCFWYIKKTCVYNNIFYNLQKLLQKCLFLGEPPVGSLDY